MPKTSVSRPPALQLPLRTRYRVSTGAQLEASPPSQGSFIWLSGLTAAHFLHRSPLSAPQLFLK